MCALVALVMAACQAAPPAEAWDPASGRSPPARVHWHVEGRAQNHSLSCESRSACDLLGYYGVEVSEDTFLAGLETSTNPEQGFVGSVDDPGGGLPPRGYGVYEEPVAARIRSLGVPAEAVRGRTLPWLRDQLARGAPVVVWAISGLETPKVQTLHDAEGRPFLAARGEHTFLAVGYDGGSILLLDPATGTEKRVRADRFDASWAVLGRRAATVQPGWRTSR